jgi:hypothetical protein
MKERLAREDSFEIHTSVKQQAVILLSGKKGHAGARRKSRRHKGHEGKTGARRRRFSS